MQSEASNNGDQDASRLEQVRKKFPMEAILSSLPHRYPFLLIDRVVDFVEDEFIAAIKCITINEPMFQGHFPGNPVFPGVLQIEALAQAGVMLAKNSPSGAAADELLVLTGVTDFKFKKPVLPGDVMRLEMRVKRFRRPLYIMDGEVTVDGEFVTGGRLSAAAIKA